MRMLPSLSHNGLTSLVSFIALKQTGVEEVHTVNSYYLRPLGLKFRSIVEYRRIIPK